MAEESVPRQFESCTGTPADGRFCCRAHRIKFYNSSSYSAKYKKKYADKSRSNKGTGICMWKGACSKNSGANIDYCEEHWFKERCRYFGFSLKLWKKLKGMLEAQNFICPYTGRKLVIGVNASMDHKSPRLRFRELAKSLDNVEWVDFEVNIMKRDRTKEEFILLCNLIASKFPLEITANAQTYSLTPFHRGSARSQEK